MARPQSVFLTGVVAMILGIVIGVVGLTALSGTLSPSADEVAQKVSNSDVAKPQVYGKR
jgi:hypothetical protein